MVAPTLHEVGNAQTDTHSMHEETMSKLVHHYMHACMHETPSEARKDGPFSSFFGRAITLVETSQMDNCFTRFSTIQLPNIEMLETTIVQLATV